MNFVLCKMITSLYFSIFANYNYSSENCTKNDFFIFAALMHATIFGNVTALVQRLYGTRKSDHQVKWKNLKDFAILHSLPKQLKQRMEDYFQTMWSLNHGIDPMEVIF